MKRESLKVEKRSILGKKIRKLRREGILPANVYGKEFKSVSVQVPIKDFLSVYGRAHETGLVDLGINSEIIPVLIHNVQIDPVTQTPLHADFFKVNLKEKITARVPVIAAGEAKAVIDKTGLLEQPVSELEVEALPTDLPERIEVNVDKLEKVDDQITVSEVKAPEGVTIITDASQVIFKIGELVTKEMEAEIAAAEAEAQAAATEAQAEAGAAPAEGEQPQEAPSTEAPAAETKSEEKPKEPEQAPKE
jgi:large subunit ribosomal protein L25